MPVAQVRINKPAYAGEYFGANNYLNLTITAPGDAQFYCDVGIEYVLPDNPGKPVVFNATVNQASAPMRRIEITPKNLYISMDVGATQEYSFVIGIASSTAIVTLLCDIQGPPVVVYITTPAGNTDLQLNGEPGVNVLLWR